MTVNVLSLHATHVPAVTTLLIDAFIDDVGMRAICAGTSEVHYRRCLAAWFLATLHVHIETQQLAWVIIVDDVIIGVALLTRPQVPFAFRAWWSWLLTVGTHCGWGVVWRTGQHERQRAAYRPPQAHALLEFITVHRDYRGQGYATLLFDAVHQWEKMHVLSAGIWLETTRPRNVPFFEYFGYVVTGRMLFAQEAAIFLFRPHD